MTSVSFRDIKAKAAEAAKKMPTLRRTERIPISEDPLGGLKAWKNKKRDEAMRYREEIEKWNRLWGSYEDSVVRENIKVLYQNAIAAESGVEWAEKKINGEI